MRSRASAALVPRLGSIRSRARRAARAARAGSTRSRASAAPGSSSRASATPGRKVRRPRLLLAGSVVAVTAAGAVAAAVAAIVLLSSAASEPAPATGAAAIVPGDALAYVHESIDGARPAVKRALALSARFPAYPLLSAAVMGRIGAIAGGTGSVDFATEIRPWLGREAALALLNTPTATAGSLIVLDVSDRRRAQAFLSRAGAFADGTHGGVRLLRYAAGTEAAFVGHYLALGQRASVRAAIDVAAGRSPSLAAEASYRRAADGEPADRVIDAYASVAGVRRVLASRGGLPGALGVLLYKPALLGSAVSVSATAGGARVRVHSALDPKLSQLGGSGSGGFVPSLQRTIPAGSTLMLDLTGLDRIAPRVLGAGAAGGLGRQIGPLLRHLGTGLSAEGVGVRGIVSIFDGETAVALVPAAPPPRPAGRAPAAAPAGAPALVIVARAPDEQRTRTELAALEAPLAQLFPLPASGPGRAPEFNDRLVAGITAHQLALEPGLEFDYAVFDGLVIVSTSLDGIAGVVHHAHALVDDPAYRSTLGASPERVTSLLFLDFSQLLRLGDQTGLTRSAGYRALRPDLEKIRAVGLRSRSGKADSTAELFLQVP